ncbi:tRNA (guanine-N(1)-)-methyltransferase domain protein [Anaplasma phagocytophilum str. ApNP]|uniref:tRNA (Guanine-N(1)-)-methyltransferase domain protein n=1 Tax=Anaplasma phagocytophilum str. ApNP TaxID=1359153 RepID=A0A0F3NGN6_ANAPH|nr:tRNA (guanine-N(1)-)-methyltransferase domain protein [Anaplasma phagocytophilum str. ApNP]
MNVFDIRAFANNKHNTVDDTPYGGGQACFSGPMCWEDA